MARHHPKRPFLPFPADIQREYFASWITGLTDGEGCFPLLCLISKKSGYRKYHATFKITLRADDCYGLELVRSFFQCGTICDQKHKKSLPEAWKPAKTFLVSNVDALVSKIIPHFERYPLLLKKSRDFEIWKKAVVLLRRVKYRCPIKTYHGAYRWTEDDKKEFMAYFHAIRAGRVYNASVVPPSLPPPPSLFDGLP
jgi:hypothetical protein